MGKVLLGQVIKSTHQYYVTNADGADLCIIMNKACNQSVILHNTVNNCVVILLMGGMNDIGIGCCDDMEKGLGRGQGEEEIERKKAMCEFGCFRRE